MNSKYTPYYHFVGIDSFPKAILGKYVTIVSYLHTKNYNKTFFFLFSSTCAQCRFSSQRFFFSANLKLCDIICLASSASFSPGCSCRSSTGTYVYLSIYLSIYLSKDIYGVQIWYSSRGKEERGDYIDLSFPLQGKYDVKKGNWDYIMHVQCTLYINFQNTFKFIFSLVTIKKSLVSFND